MATVTADYTVKRTGLRAILYNGYGEEFHTAKLYCPSDERMLRKFCEALVDDGEYESYRIINITVEVKAGE